MPWPGIADDAADRGDVDDAAIARLGAHHGARGGAHQHEGRGEVDGDDVVPLIVLHHHEQVVLGEAGVVDEDVEPAELGDRLVDQLGHLRLVAEVAGADVHARAELGGQLLELVDLAPGDGDRRPLLVQRAGDAAADAAGCAGDQRRLVGEIEHVRPLLHFVSSADSTASISCGVPTETALSVGTMRLASPASTLPEPIS